MLIIGQYKDEWKTSLLATLVFINVLLLSYLVKADVSDAVFTTAVFGLPAAIVCQRFLMRQRSLNIRVSLAASILGGFAMLLACWFETGPLGLSNLLDMCQDISANSSFLSVEWIWKKILLTPWTYLAMLIGCSIGMWFFREEKSLCTETMLECFFVYMFCNVSMLYGMFLFEYIAMSMVINSDFFNAILFMLIMMLSGMSLGLLGFVCISEYVSRKIFLSRQKLTL